LDIKALDRFLKEFDPAFQGFNQGNFQIWAGQGDNYAWQACA
jgi:hypothetical protein